MVSRRRCCRRRVETVRAHLEKLSANAGVRADGRWTPTEEHRRMNNVIDFINVNRERYLEELKALLAIPSISALPEHTGDVRRCAEWCARRDDAGRPAERPADRDARQSGRLRRLARRAPARRRFCSTATTTCSRSIRSSLWESPPFEATIRDGEIYARGAADDKGQVFMHLKAIEAHLQAERPPAGEHQDHPRGRRGGRQRPSRRLHPRPQDRAGRRRRRHLRLDDVRQGRAVDLLRPARAGLLPDRSARQQHRPAFRLLRRQRSPTRRSCWRR